MVYGRIIELGLAPECAKSFCYDVDINVRDVLKIRVEDYRAATNTFVSGCCRISCARDGLGRNESLTVRVSKK